jgi:DNA-binding MarR family transcriptional regulator
MRDLTPAQTAVWLTLFRDERKGVSKSAQTYIAERCGLSRESVSRAINELELRGLVQTLHQGGLNQGLSWYRVKALNKQ